MTIKLYDTDSHIKTFKAEVLACEAAGDGWAVELDRTAFFPEGGGQSGDRGLLGGAQVLDTQIKNGRILHYTDSPLTPDSTVQGEIDWARRFRAMQNHSGEHIVCSIVHRLYGYENVGFHLGDDIVTFDFDGELTAEQLTEIELMANEAVWANVPVTVSFPEPEELISLEYRSKLDLTEGVRIVTIEGLDRCACCAPHVARTGEIGAIKFIDHMRHRGGMRIQMRCGIDALTDYRARCQSTLEISRLLSAPQEDVAHAVSRFMEQLEARDYSINGLKRELVQLKLAAIPDEKRVSCLFEPLLDTDSARELVNGIIARSGGTAGVFTGAEGSWRYVIGSDTTDLRAAAKEINSAINGRGGGTPAMIQGSCSAGRAAIEEFFKSLQL